MSVWPPPFFVFFQRFRKGVGRRARRLTGGHEAFVDRRTDFAAHSCFVFSEGEEGSCNDFLTLYEWQKTENGKKYLGLKIHSKIMIKSQAKLYAFFLPP